MDIEKQDYTVELDNASSVCDTLETEFNNYTYIGDAIAELSDSSVEIYTKELWRDAYNFKEWTESAISEGLVSCEGEVDMTSIFMAGEYQYYSQTLYNNIEEIVYNVLINELDSVDIPEGVEVDSDDLEELATTIIESDRADNVSELVEEMLADKVEDSEGEGLNESLNQDKDIKKRLEYLRQEIRDEKISTEELIELESLIPFIDEGDVELLQWAGVPE